MVNYKTFQISDALIWGFQVKVDIDECDSTDDIVTIVKNKTIEFMDKHNLQIIKEQFVENCYDIHTDFSEILLRDEIFYVCCH